MHALEAYISFYSNFFALFYLIRFRASRVNDSLLIRGYHIFIDNCIFKRFVAFSVSIVERFIFYCCNNTLLYSVVTSIVSIVASFTLFNRMS